ncbi:MAG: FAD-dependent oxidoreductase, partial [Planctomycetia bacterium]|nr:FAD-dependent oxidoreductase [Planctomycetia bacterium]
MKNRNNIISFFSSLLVLFTGFCVVMAESSQTVDSLPIADSAQCDVVVVGSGPAGTVAAIQAGRLGAKTVLIEAAPILGGNMTIGGVNSPESFFKWKPNQEFQSGKQVIAGIGWEWCSKTAQLDNGELPDSKRHYRINPAVLVAVGEELCQAAGVEIRYYESPVRVERLTPDKNAKSNSPWNWKLTTCSLGQMRVILCKELVDCTGNATLCALAGAERMREDEIMAGSLIYVIKHNVDVKKMPRGEYERLYNKAMKEGRLKHGDARNGCVGL